MKNKDEKTISSRFALLRRKIKPSFEASEFLISSCRNFCPCRLVEAKLGTLTKLEQSGASNSELCRTVQGQISAMAYSGHQKNSFLTNHFHELKIIIARWQ